MLRDLSPNIKRVIYVRSRQTGVATQSLLARFTDDARSAGLIVTDGAAESAEEIERAVRSFADSPDGGLISAFDAFNLVHRPAITEMAARYRLPAVYSSRSSAERGELCCYGFDQAEQFRQAASYVSRLLSGEKTSELPVQTPTKFELLLNLKTAKALGLVISPSLLAAADEIIE